MSLPTIILDNTTASDIVLRQLAVTVPASGSYTVSDFNSPSEILNDEELQTALDAGDITVTYMAVVLTLEQSKALIQPITALDIKHNLTAVVPPGVGDDDAAGYSVGSNWIDTVGESAFQCVDDTTVPPSGPRRAHRRSQRVTRCGLTPSTETMSRPSPVRWPHPGSS